MSQFPGSFGLSCQSSLTLLLYLNTCVSKKTVVRLNLFKTVFPESQLRLERTSGPNLLRAVSEAAAQDQIFGYLLWERKLSVQSVPESAHPTVNLVSANIHNTQIFKTQWKQREQQWKMKDRIFFHPKARQDIKMSVHKLTHGLLCTPGKEHLIKSQHFPASFNCPFLLQKNHQRTVFVAASADGNSCLIFL